MRRTPNSKHWQVWMQSMQLSLPLHANRSQVPFRIQTKHFELCFVWESVCRHQHDLTCRTGPAIKIKRLELGSKPMLGFNYMLLHKGYTSVYIYIICKVNLMLFWMVYLNKTLAVKWNKTSPALRVGDNLPPANLLLPTFWHLKTWAWLDWRIQASTWSLPESCKARRC